MLTPNPVTGLCDATFAEAPTATRQSANLPSHANRTSLKTALHQQGHCCREHIQLTAELETLALTTETVSPSLEDTESQNDVARPDLSLEVLKDDFGFLRT